MSVEGSVPSVVSKHRPLFVEGSVLLVVSKVQASVCGSTGPWLWMGLFHLLPPRTGLDVSCLLSLSTGLCVRRVLSRLLSPSAGLCLWRGSVLLVVSKHRYLCQWRGLSNLLSLSTATVYEGFCPVCCLQAQPLSGKGVCPTCCFQVEALSVEGSVPSAISKHMPLFVEGSSRLFVTYNNCAHTVRVV